MDLIPPSWSSHPANISSSAADGNSTDNDPATFLNDGEEQLFQGYSPALLTFASATCIVFILIGIPGNLITIIALARCKRVRNATAVFIINLSLSDLLFCCFNLPLAASTFWRRAWVHGDLLCKLFPLMRYGLLAVSLFTILAITINRYVMIGHPRIYPKIYQRRYLAIMVAATWLCAFCSLIPTWRGAWGTFGLDKSIGSCTILKDRNGNSPKEFLFIMAFVVPCISIVGCYARIFYIVRKTAMRSHEPILVTSSIKMTSSAGAKPIKTSHRGKAHHSVEKTPKTSREENSENSSSISSSTVIPQAPMISIPEIMQGEPDNSPESKSLPDKDQPTVPSGLSRSSERPRPFLSKLRDDELKFIDTSVDSEFPPSLSTLREGTTSKSPDDSSTHSFSTARTRTLNGSRTSRNGNNNITHLRVDVDSAVEDSTSSSENNQVFQILGSNNPDSQFLSVTVEPSSSSGIDIPNDQESPPSRPQHFKKSLKSSTQKSSKRSLRKISTMNTSGASLLYPGRMTQKDRRLLKMILVIFLSFLICYLPITITKIAKGATEIHTFNIMGYLLIYLTTCINPIIYVVMSSEYRQAYVNLLMCRPAATTRRNGQFCGTPIGPGNIAMNARKNEQKNKALKKRAT